MSQKLFLSTADALDSTNPSEAEWSLNDYLMTQMVHFTLSLEKVVFPNTRYPINDYNQNFYFTEDDGVTVLQGVLSEGVYSAVEYAEAIADAFAAATEIDGGLGVPSGTYTVIYDTLTDKLTIEETGGLIAWYFTFGDNAGYEEMGINTALFETADQVVGPIITSESPINISGEQVVYVQTNLQTRNRWSARFANILVAIPIQGTYGSVLTFTAQELSHLDMADNVIDTIRLNLLDNRGRPWRLPANAVIDWVFHIQDLPEGNSMQLARPWAVNELGREGTFGPQYG